MRIALIVALAENQVIGCGNRLPWHLAEDLARFKRITMGKPVIMGRKTFESIGRPLPGRTNILITRQPASRPDGVFTVASLDEALNLARKVAIANDAEEVMIIGGEQIYRQALPLVDRIYLTQVHAKVEGDAYFPSIDLTQWHEVDSSCPDTPGDPAYSFHILDRIKRS